MTAINKVPIAPRKKGRPLSFDRDIALNKAMMLFWEHGYEATSLNDLTSALGVKPSSIYSAFGDKKSLFFEAVDLYLGGDAALQKMLSQAPTARAAVKNMLDGAVVAFTADGKPKGCLLASAALSCSDAALDVRQSLGVIRRNMEAQVRDRIAVGIARQELRGDAGALAGLAIALVQGLSTLARDGASREKLTRIDATAFQGWPDDQT